MSNDFARQTQFDYLYQGIQQRYPGLFVQSKETQFQFMEMPFEADWTSGNYTSAYNLADTVPAKLGGFYAAGASRVTLAYESLLQSMYKAIGEKNPEYRSLKDMVQTHYKQLETRIAEALQRFTGWQRENPGNATGFEEWLSKSMIAISYKKRIDDLIADIERKNEKCKQIEGALGKALATAQEKLYTDVISLEDGTKVPRTTIGGNLQDDIARWKGNKEQFDLNVLINKDQQLTTPWHETVKVEAKAVPCHPPELKTYVNVQRLVLDQHYSLTVKAVGLQGYPITRGSWYNDSFVRPDIALPQGATLKTEDFFGEKGSLHLIPTSVLVIYHPVLELTVSTQVYKEEFESNTKLKAFSNPMTLFGLSFDVRASYERGVKVKDGTTTMTIVPPEDQSAQILGFTSVNKSI